MVMIFHAVPTYCKSSNTKKKSFDAKYVALMEKEMWQAYYKKEKVKLSLLLIQLLNKQFDISPKEAGEVGALLASSALKFKSAKPEHYDDALPDLIKAYTQIKKYSGLSFNPEDAAKAELAWWVDRRTPGRNDPKTIGEGITLLYETIYGYKHAGFTRAGKLRSEAAHLRDQGGKNCDWKQVEKLLLQSYQALREGIEKK